tara:strand:- start:4595 stop:6121 length:1527 start_codon:yes stop_codon:yes gene_type:complete
MAQVLPFNGFYTGNSEKNSARTCVNYMPIRHDAGALSEYTLESTTGISLHPSESFSRDPGDMVSSVFEWSGNLSAFQWDVCGVYEGGFLVTASGGSYDVIDLLIDTPTIDKVRVSYNHDIVLIVDEIGASNVQQSIYSYQASTDTVTLTDISAQLGANVRLTDTVYFGSRFLLMSTIQSGVNKGRVYYSDIEDPTSYDTLGFFKSLSQTHDNIGMYLLNERLYLFTNNDFTVWINTPDVNLPFSQQKGSAGTVGLVSTDSACKVGNKLYIVGKEVSALGLYVFGSGGAEKISTEYIDQSIKDTLDAFVFYFSDNGRDFVGFTCGALGRVATYCYDLQTGEFHTRSTNGGAWNVRGSGTNTEGQNIFYGDSSVLDSGSDYFAQIGRGRSNIGTEFGYQVEREMVTSPFNSDGVTNNVRELAFQTDIDYSSLTPVTLPNLSLSVSENFGKTFEAERLESFDADGENTKILRYMNIGFFRQAFVFKLKTSTIYPHKILKMLTRLEKGFRQI